MAETPFSPEQLQKLTEISRLPPEEQKKILPGFLQTLTAEQIKFLQDQQQQAPKEGQPPSCPFCMIAGKQLQSVILYEDEQCQAVFDIRPATKGHTLLFPKAHVADFTSLTSEQATHLFSISQQLMGVLEDIEGCEGVNLFVANGRTAGQTVDHALIHLIPRYKDDGLHLTWESKNTATADTLQQLHQQLQAKLAGLATSQKTSESQPTSAAQPTETYEENDEEPFAQF